MMIKTKLFDPNFEKDNCGFGLIAQKMESEVDQS